MISINFLLLGSLIAPSERLMRIKSVIRLSWASALDEFSTTTLCSDMYATRRGNFYFDIAEDLIVVVAVVHDILETAQNHRN